MTETRILADIMSATNIARTSPSSHNCQPWKLKLLDEQDLQKITANKPRNDKDCAFLQLQFDKQRLLNTLPSLRAEMYLSCGGFFALFCDALRGLGYAIETQWVDNEEVLVNIQICREQDINKETLLAMKRTGQKRKTNRGLYKQVTTSDDKIRSLFPDTPQTTLHLIESDEQIKRIAGLVKTYSSLDFSNKHVWEETYSYIRFDDEQPAEDGFFLHNLFGPVSPIYKQLFRFGLHPNNHWLYNSLGIPKVMAKGLAELVENTPQLMAISIDQWNTKTQFDAGEALNIFWRRCTQNNLAIHPLSVLLQNDEPKKELQTELQCNKPLVFIARIGIPEVSASESPRRSAESITGISVPA